MNDLRTIDEFRTAGEYKATKERIESLVQDGKLREQGLDPSEPSLFVEIYVSDEGETWLFAHPDQAFRGYLRQK